MVTSSHQPLSASVCTCLMHFHFSGAVIRTLIYLNPSTCYIVNVSKGLLSGVTTNVAEIQSHIIEAILATPQFFLLPATSLQDMITTM